MTPARTAFPPARGRTVPPRALSSPESRWLQRDGYAVHYESSGRGEPAFLLLHGFGASVFAWRKVFDQFARMGMAVAYDRPGFGLTERPLPGSWHGDSPYGDEANVRLAIAVADAVGAGPIVLVGHSAGGKLAVLTAHRHPGRVAGLVLIAPALGDHPRPSGLMRALTTTSLARRAGPALLRLMISRAGRLLDLAWYDRSRISPADLDGYLLPMASRDWDRGLWEVVVAPRVTGVAGLAAGVPAPVLLLTGDNDRIVPPDATRALVKRFPSAELAVIPECGHLPHEERPAEFMAAVQGFLGRLPAWPTAPATSRPGR